MSDSPTEARAEASLEALPTGALVALLIDDQAKAAEAVRAQHAAIAQVVEAIAGRLSRGGVLHYAGAGTSGRLGVLDAAEMAPTFGVSPELVCAHIAGGEAALRGAVEGAEDDAEAGSAAVRGHVHKGDAVIGISASGGARYVGAVLEAARALGAYTAAITSNPHGALLAYADDAIVLATGAEALAGSTRLKAGTAQKIALNAVSTAVMVRLGHVRGNLMIDVVATNEKLRRRALGLVRCLTGADETRARAALEASGWNVRAAMERLAAR